MLQLFVEMALIREDDGRGNDAQLVTVDLCRGPFTLAVANFARGIEVTTRDVRGMAFRHDATIAANQPIASGVLAFFPW